MSKWGRRRSRWEVKQEGVLARRSCRASWEKNILGRDKNVHTENSRHVEETTCETAQSLRREERQTQQGSRRACVESTLLWKMLWKYNAADQ